MICFDYFNGWVFKVEMVLNVIFVVLGLGEFRDICCEFGKMNIVELIVELEFFVVSRYLYYKFFIFVF